jgi:dTDP-4-dehydrorhamnose reductase
MAQGAILVTGGRGQLATALAGLAPAEVHVVGRPAFDFDRPETLAACLEAARPAVVVNAAAWTGVDAAESDPEGARRANEEGPALLAALCRERGIPLIHFSTDYVFDGEKGAPYVETDPTAPTGVYGATKLAGERAVLAFPRAVVLRTSWLYSPWGKNFVRTMLNLAQTRDRLRVVADQRGCPTAATELARVTLEVARAAQAGWRDEFAGVFHTAGDGATTWHGFAEAIFEEATRYGLRKPTVDAITTAEYPTPARRPADSRLDCAKLELVFGLRQKPWRESLAAVIAQIQPRAEARA